MLSTPLGVRRGPDASEAAKSRTPSKAQTEKTLSRDAYACRCCGFESKKFQRVIEHRQIAVSAKEDAWVTVCSFCEMCTNLERAGLTGAGWLIWLPEIKQAELNNIVRALYVAQSSDDPKLSKAAGRTLEVLTARRAEAKKRLGTDDPLLLATALHEQVSDKVYANRAEKLEGIRFLPLDRYFVTQRSGRDVNVFAQMMDFWKSPSGPYGQLPVAQWTALFDEVKAKMEEGEKAS